MKKSKKTALFSWLFAIVLLLVSAFTLFHHVLQIESGIRRACPPCKLRELCWTPTAPQAETPPTSTM